MVSRITPETAKMELDRILEGATRSTQAYQIAAAIVLDDCEFLKNNLKDRGLIDYLRENSAFPATLQQVIGEYLTRRTSYDLAQSQITALRECYKQAFSEAGIRPLDAQEQTRVRTAKG